MNYDLIPRKHVDPVRRLILRHQTDTTGTSWDEYPDLLFIGSPDDPGLLVKAAIWVIYKRNDVADWAQFAEVFGAPIREYTYPTDDDEARQRALDDADSTGSLSVFVHAEDTVLKLVEAANKTGSADLYDKLCERCNNENLKAVPRKHAHHRSLRQGHTGTGNRTQGRGGESDALRQAGHPRRAQL